MDRDSRPKVSVILVTYNQSRFLARAISSLLGQSFRDFELIVVDDCSPDGSGALAERLTQGTGARVVRHASNVGQYQTYNRSLPLARGEYVLFASGDDVNAPDLLAREVAALERNPGAGMAFANVLLVDENDHVIRDLAALQAHTMPWLRQDYVQSGVVELARLLNENYVVCIGCVMMRRASLESLGGWDETMPQAADWDLWLRFASRYDVAYVAEPLVGWRQHADTVTSRLRRSGRYYEDNVRVLQKALANLPAGAEHLAARGPELLGRAHLAAGFADIAAGRAESGRARMATAAALHPGLLGEREEVVDLLCRHGVSLLDPRQPSAQVVAYVDRTFACLPVQQAWWPARRDECCAQALWAAAGQARAQGDRGAVRRHVVAAGLLNPRAAMPRELLVNVPAFLPLGNQLLSLYRRARARRAPSALARSLQG